MKVLGCVAAGGSGSRLAPATKVVNKHLIPTEPNTLMIDYPIRQLKGMGFEKVTVVTGSNHASQIVDYVGDGDKYELREVNYAFQSKAAGIADIFKRISVADSHTGVLLILGDNYFSDIQDVRELNTTIHHHGSAFEKYIPLDKAMCWQYDVKCREKAKSFGQIQFYNEVPERIVEKPQEPQHTKILTGMYYFPNDVFKMIEALKPSKRNELEITDLLGIYLAENRLIVKDVIGEWADLGEWHSLQGFWKSRG